MDKFMLLHYVTQLKFSSDAMRYALKGRNESIIRM